MARDYDDTVYEDKARLSDEEPDQTDEDWEEWVDKDRHLKGYNRDLGFYEDLERRVDRRLEDEELSILPDDEDFNNLDGDL